MKNFILVSAPVSRIEPYILLHLAEEMDDGDREYRAFSRFSRWLVERRGASNNTIQSYCEHAARFIDFVYEASHTEFINEPDFGVDYLLFCYQSFLLFGKDSDNPMAKELAFRLGKNKRTNVSSIRHNIEYAVRYFLEWTYLNPDVSSQDSLLGRVYKGHRAYRTNFEVSAHMRSSWLAGTIQDALSGALPKRKGNTVFPGVSKRKTMAGERFSTKPIPVEKVASLLEAPKSKRSSCYWRDMTFYSLLAASGARSHEVLQIRMSDIKLDSEEYDTVELHPPFGRNLDGVTENEYEKLTWKGRQTHLTFLIEPFATIFWENLRNYLNKEYCATVNHDFLFQACNGRPLFVTDRSSRDKTFKKYAFDAGVMEVGISLHSFRHMYGSYVLNYLPMPDNESPGLPLAYVQIIMGHGSPVSTQRYAKHDIDMINTLLEYSNQRVTQQGRDSLLTIRERYYKYQLKKVEAKIDRIEERKKRKEPMEFLRHIM